MSERYSHMLPPDTWLYDDDRMDLQTKIDMMGYHYLGLPIDMLTHDEILSAIEKVLKENCEREFELRQKATPLELTIKKVE